MQIFDDTTFFSLSRAYAARMSFYRLKQFQCEVTGKSGLTYFQAVESERAEARTLHSRFAEPLKPAILKAVQWRKSPTAVWIHTQTLTIILEVMGRLDHLVEAVFDRFKDRYFKDESPLCNSFPRLSSLLTLRPPGVLVDLSGTKYVLTPFSPAD